MKHLKLCAHTLNGLLLVGGLAVALSPRSVEATVRTYDFENLANGNLNGQDGWTKVVFAGAQEMQVGAGTGVNTSRVADSLAGRSFSIRQYDSNFSFPTPQATGIVDFQADLKTQGGEANQAGVIFYQDSTIDFRFYEAINGGIDILQYIRNDNVSLNISLPVRVAFTDWLRIRVEANVNPGVNTASLYYEDLTKGDTSFSLLSGPITFLSAGSPAPSTLNRIGMDITGGAVDNIMMDVLPEPSTVVLMLAGGVLLWRRGRRR